MTIRELREAVEAWVTNTSILVTCTWACVAVAAWYYGAGAAGLAVVAAFLAAWAEASRRV